MMERENKGMLLGILGVVAFALTLPITRIVLPYFDPFFVGFGRAVVAAIVAILFLLVYRIPLPNRQQCCQLVIVGLGVVIGFPVFATWSMQFVPATHGGVVLGILPLATVIAGIVVDHEKPSKAFLFFSVLGTVLVMAYVFIQGDGNVHIADLGLLAAIISAAIGYAVGAKLSRELVGWQVICWALVISLPLTIPPTFYFFPTKETLFELPFSVIVSFAYLALVSQLFGFVLWYKGLALGGISRVSQVQLLQTFITLIASALFVGEFVDNMTIIFSLLIVAIVWCGKAMPVGGARECSVISKA